MRQGFRIDLMTGVTAVAVTLLTSAQAQDAAVQEQNVLVFIFAFVGAIVLSAFIASKLIRPQRPDPSDHIIPLPLPRPRKR